MGISENVMNILKSLPPGVRLLAATKSRSVDEIQEAIDAGVDLIGENYVQEAAKKFEKIGRRVEWHFIGHLQKNKVKKALQIFDVIETVDSLDIAREINKRAESMGKIAFVMIEINSAREPQKFGVMPENALDLADEIFSLENLQLIGVMTMGPTVSKPEDIRPYFSLTRKIFDELRYIYGDEQIRYLSMGMTDTWRIGVQEGANIVRIGTGIFGPRGEQGKLL
ncbi:YggS family pyridoxal phosphate-dependent enzyme [Aciduliprofundum sp. MAR08-339]|uniref:YggS family pyridoxal phosphate-dependent enzyme n=1 Tax=Aciduliprofundum sp. (strain MAR08-339) TaxID=673860 RepID=UPI00064EDB2B